MATKLLMWRSWKARLQRLLSNVLGDLCSHSPDLICLWLLMSVTLLLLGFGYIPTSGHWGGLSGREVVPSLLLALLAQVPA